jgi:hypothetical protein
MFIAFDQVSLVQNAIADQPRLSGETTEDTWLVFLNPSIEYSRRLFLAKAWAIKLCLRRRKIRGECVFKPPGVRFQQLDNACDRFCDCHEKNHISKAKGGQINTIAEVSAWAARPTTIACGIIEEAEFLLPAAVPKIFDPLCWGLVLKFQKLPIFLGSGRLNSADSAISTPPPCLFGDRSEIRDKVNSIAREIRTDRASVANPANGGCIDLSRTELTDRAGAITPAPTNEIFSDVIKRGVARELPSEGGQARVP